MYELHNAQVLSTVPTDRLLEFTVTDGWAPLCQFLGQPVPSVPFPHTNDSGAMRNMRLILLVVIYGWVPALVLITICVARCMINTRRKDKVS